MAQDSANTLGEFLRQERERRGITIEQVASATKIGVRLLHSLEADQFADLPAKPFVRGFVTSYARFVGVDPHEVLTRFGDYIDQRAHDRPSREGGHSGYAFERRENSRTVLWFVMAGFIALGGVAIFLVKKPGFRHRHGTQIEKLRAAHSGLPEMTVAEGSPGAATSIAPAAELVAATASPSPAPSLAATVAEPSPSAAPAIEEAAAPSPKAEAEEEVAAAPSPKVDTDKLHSGADLSPSEVKYKTVIRATASVWVRYKVDAKPLTRFILRSGRMLVLKGKQAIRFQSSDPDEVEVRSSDGSFSRLSDLTEGVGDRNGTTLYRPAELAEKTDDPFPGEKSIAGWAVPAPKTSTPVSTPTP
jgi:cytoskeletal protein RodZ